MRWADDTETGDRAELPFEPHFRAWAMVSTTARECPGAFRCPSGRDCFAEDARARAAGADVVVVNTHLYGAHLASGGAVLPEHQVVVFDEAHEVEDVMTDSLGLEVGPGASGRWPPPPDRSSVTTTARRGPWRGSPTWPTCSTGCSGPGRAGGCPMATWPRAADTDGPGAPSDRAADGGRRRAGRTRPRTRPAPAGPEGQGRRRVPPARRRRATAVGSDPDLATLLALATGRVGRLVDHLRRAERDGDMRSAGERSRRDRVLLAAGHLAADLARLACWGTARWPGWRTAPGPRPCGSPPSTSAPSWPSSSGAR